MATAPASLPTTIVPGPAISGVNGVASALSINNEQMASFPFTVPAVSALPPGSQASKQFHIIHFQTGNSTNATPRVAGISKTSGDIPTPPTGGYPKGYSGPDAAWMYGTGGVAQLACILDGGSQVSFDKGIGLCLHCKTGDTWYVSFANRDPNGRPSSPSDAPANVSVKAE
jgi:hypothetical protein